MTAGQQRSEQQWDDTGAETQSGTEPNSGTKPSNSREHG